MAVTYEISVGGQGSGVIELPIERIVDDAPYYGAASGSLPSPTLVTQIWRQEFDVAYRERGLFVLTMHPHLSGHRSRVAALEKLVVHMKSLPRRVDRDRGADRQVREGLQAFTFSDRVKE